VFFGGKDGFLYALSLGDGKEAWKSRPLRAITAAPHASETVVCIQSFYGATQAYDATTGAELWRANLGGSLQSTPIITDEAVYLAAYSGVVYALR
jgi:outer membrane protein assembly factor BamB